jgi:hypothetical protein
MATPYLREALRFIGVSDVRFVLIGPTVSPAEPARGAQSSETAPAARERRGATNVRRMYALTRRRDPDAREHCWHIHCGDIRTITRTGGVRSVEPIRQCSFCPRSHPSKIMSGSDPASKRRR